MYVGMRTMFDNICVCSRSRWRCSGQSAGRRRCPLVRRWRNLVRNTGDDNINSVIFRIKKRDKTLR